MQAVSQAGTESHALPSEGANRRVTVKLLLSVALLAVSGVMLYRFLLAQRPPDEQAFFYDLSEKKLFAVPRTTVPPARGLNDAEMDAVRAVVVSTSGNPKDKRHQRIAYLEKYAPELKQQIEARQQGGTIAADQRIDRIDAQSLTFVRRVSDPQWYPVNSAEAEKIMIEWQVPGPKGEMPAVCVP
jgi:hypothetical protein